MTCKPINAIHRFLNILAIQTPLNNVTVFS